MQSFKSSACFLGRNPRRRIVGLNVEREPVWLPTQGIVRFYSVIVGSCAVIALLAAYVQKARSIERVSHRVEVVTFGLK